MAQADDMNQAVDEIADRVRRRMQALRAGKEQPCTTSPGPAARDPEPPLGALGMVLATT